MDGSYLILACETQYGITRRSTYVRIKEILKSLEMNVN